MPSVLRCMGRSRMRIRLVFATNVSSFDSQSKWRSGTPRYTGFSKIDVMLIGVRRDS